MAEEVTQNTGDNDKSAGTENNTPPAKVDDKSLVSGGGKSDDKSQVPATWPDDWRQKLAGDDEKTLKRLERMQSPADLFKSYKEIETKLSSGKLVDELPADATEEDVKAYRERNGIPDDPKGYLENLPDGLVFGEEDEMAVSGFLDRMHKGNVPPQIVQEALAWYTEYQEEAQTAQVEADREFRVKAEEDLREEWGNEYRANVNTIKNFLATAPEGLDAQLMGARLADGSLLGDNPAALRWLAKLANDANPAGFVAPSGGKDQLSSVEDELNTIRQLRKTDPTKYWADEKMQARELKLIEAREKLAG